MISRAALLRAALAALSLAPSAFALDQIIRPYQSARSAAMGGVLYTTGFYDENFFGNPARALANPKWRIDVIGVTAEVNRGSMKNFDKLTASGDKIENAAGTAGTNNHVRVQTVMPAVYIPHFFSDDNAFAIGIITSTQADVDLRKNFSIEPSVYADVGPAVTYARRFMGDKLSVGITGYYMYRLTTSDSFSTIDYIRGVQFSKIKDEAAEGAMLDGDIGFAYDLAGSTRNTKSRRPWNIQPAFTISRVAGGKFRKAPADLNKKSDILPEPARRAFAFGTSFTRHKFWGFNDIVTAIEIQDIGNNPHGSLFRTLHIGSEAQLWRRIKFRAGINQGYLTGGIGFDLPVLDIDVSTYGEEMTLNTGGMEDRRYALRVTFSL